MKKIFLFLLVFGTIVSCNKGNNEDFVKTELGFAFKHCTVNKDAPKAKVGDILYGEMEIRLNDSIKLTSNFGSPDRLFKILEPTKGSIDEFLLNLHIGDSAIMIAPADSVAKFVSGINCKKDDKIYFYIKVQQIIAKREMDEHEKEVKQKEDDENKVIQEYIEINKIEPIKRESGLYYLSILEGNGAKPDFGKKVTVNYIVSTLDGKILDTSLKSIAQKGGIYSKDRNYEAFSFYLGDDGVIPGWTEGVSLMKVGGKSRLIVPSRLAYGEDGFGRIKPFTTLIFEITLLSVE